MAVISQNSILKYEKILLSHALNRAGDFPEIFVSVKKETFLNLQNGLIFQAMKELIDANSSISSANVISCLERSNLLSRAGGPEYLAEIISNYDPSEDVNDAILAMNNQYGLRLYTTLFQKWTKSLESSSKSAQELLADAEKIVIQVTQEQYVAMTESFSDINNNVYRKIHQLAEGKNKVTGTKTHFHYLDSITGGFQPGDLLIIAARPGVGKTAFALNIFKNVGEDCLRNGTCAFFSSLEMSKEQLVMRMYASETGINLFNIKTGQNLSARDWEKIEETNKAFGKLPVYIDDSSTVKLSELRAKLKKIHAQRKLELVVIDYLQLISIEGSRSNRQEDVAYMSRSLKNLARELNVPILALSQLSRKVESREDKRPLLSDLRESGSIEQDADIVMLLYREDYYDSEDGQEHRSNHENNTIEINLAKHRNGEAGKFTLVFDKGTGTFANFKNN